MCRPDGISCFVDESGELHQSTKWWVPDIISGKVKPNNNKTFFASFGDLISYAMLVIGSVVFLSSILLKYTRKK